MLTVHIEEEVPIISLVICIIDHGQSVLDWARNGDALWF